ncbi:MAG: hypothetical protein EO766_16430 [Hydrotalea sp. AMD]|uniref:hypothetical protein n=1 Tax=Hydrotalea sp. AMD TaxID=2501297 RepID=UPI001024C1FB|nr:hypothetical protein [Hydrotalea sp. AMD]RWZ85649.1 MAG: hypothetical protein EO766_16430 [Hydrotalea sp. AMD]
MWKRKFHAGHFEHFHNNIDVACFKGADGWRFRFTKSVPCDNGEFYGYAKSIHFWKTLSAVKAHVERILMDGGEFAMVVVDVDKRELLEGYRFKDGRLELQ